MRRSLLTIGVLAGAAILGAAACEPPPECIDDAECGAGLVCTADSVCVQPEPEPDCIIGDPAGEAEIVLVYRTVDGEVADVVDGAEVPLILPPQGGKVTLVGVRAKNVTCRALLNVGISDELCGGSFIGRDGRPIELEEGPDGFGYPAAPTTLQNYGNIPVCPTFGSSRDGDGQPYVLELRMTEARRLGEETARTHVLTTTVTPVCAEPDILADCLCECDADLILDDDREEQCPTIHDNDIEPGTCPAGDE